MSQLSSIAELDKLARLSGVPRSQLDSLVSMPHGQLREMRRALSEKLFQIDEPVFRRLARLANRLPSVVLAWFAQRIFGPLITARVAGLMIARRAVRTARGVQPAFLAEVSIHLDPRYARDILSQLPSQQIVEIVKVMIAKDEHLTMGRFVDSLSDETIQAVINAIEEEEDLVRIAYYMESKNRLDHVLRMMPRERLRKAILLVLEPERDLMLQLMSLVLHAGYELQHELGELAAEQDESVLNEIVSATQTHALWGDLLPVITLLSADTQRKVVNLPILREPGVLESILDASDKENLWRNLLPLVCYMDELMLDAVAEIASKLPREAIARVADGALMAELWDPLGSLVVRMSEAKKAEIAEILTAYGEVDADLFIRLKSLAKAYGLEAYFKAA